jgi:hypothetical protein
MKFVFCVGRYLVIDGDEVQLESFIEEFFSNFLIKKELKILKTL